MDSRRKNSTVSCNIDVNQQMYLETLFRARLEAASELNELCNSPSKIKKKLNEDTNDSNQPNETV